MQVTATTIPASRPARGTGPAEAALASCSRESVSDAALATPSLAAPLGNASLSNTPTSRSACAAFAAKQAALYRSVGCLSAAAFGCCSKQETRNHRLLLRPVDTKQGPGLSCMAAHAGCSMSHQPCMLCRKLVALMPSCVRSNAQLTLQRSYDKRDRCTGTESQTNQASSGSSAPCGCTCPLRAPCDKAARQQPACTSICLHHHLQQTLTLANWLEWCRCRCPSC